MVSYIEQIQDLRFEVDAELAQDLLLSSLDDSFSQFIMNYNMQHMDHTFLDLLNMSVAAENKGKKESGSVAIVIHHNKSSNLEVLVKMGLVKVDILDGSKSKGRKKEKDAVVEETGWWVKVWTKDDGGMDYWASKETLAI
ncbi:hypothetical protein ACLB2K_016499 [Fragaria x ananassa]